MTQEEQILKMFDEYFANTPKSEIDKDIAFINSMGSNGISYESYIEMLNYATSIDVQSIGICDDIAFADLFNNSIMPVKMDDSNSVTLLKDFIKVASNNTVYGINPQAGESNYAMAA